MPLLLVWQEIRGMFKSCLLRWCVVAVVVAAEVAVGVDTAVWSSKLIVLLSVQLCLALFFTFSFLFVFAEMPCCLHEPGELVLLAVQSFVFLPTPKK